MRLVGVWVRVLWVEETLLGLLGRWWVVRRSVRRRVRLLGELVFVVVDALRLELVDVTADNRSDIYIDVLLSVLW